MRKFRNRSKGLGRKKKIEKWVKLNSIKPLVSRGLSERDLKLFYRIALTPLSELFAEVCLKSKTLPQKATFTVALAYLAGESILYLNQTIDKIQFNREKTLKRVFMASVGNKRLANKLAKLIESKDPEINQYVRPLTNIIIELGNINVPRGTAKERLKFRETEAGKKWKEIKKLEDARHRVRKEFAAKIMQLNRLKRKYEQN